MDDVQQANRPKYRYRFDDVDFDESRMTLRVAGERVDLQPRPLHLLALLLQRVGEVVPRAELFDTVWEGRPTVDNVLANAVAKLRKALGATAGQRLVNVPRVGYCLRGPVERSVAGRRSGATSQLAVGKVVPGREHFLLVECLDPSGDAAVWLARHEKTSEPRVYKFATGSERVESLKREVTIYRVLRESLGERDERVRVFDWNFEEPPFWLECEYAGRDLARWATEAPVFAEATREQRIGWFIEIAQAVVAAHSAGVLHKDLKPANVLVAPRGNGWRWRVADFGSGRLLEPGNLEKLGITRLGLTVTNVVTGQAGMTLLYLAPELLAGAAPTVKSDVYALGLMLFQMVVGDLHRTLAPGWEQDIDDELLCEDIAAATHGDPGRRLASADALVQRLLSREARAIERERLRESDARALVAERLLERARGRRPWLIAAIVLLGAGLGVSLWQIHRVRAAQAEVQQQAALAAATNRFLNKDLLGAGSDSPAWYERNPSLREILDAAASKIDRRFGMQPLMQATLHQTLARAYRSTGDYGKAAVEWQAAADGWQRVAGAADPRTLIAQYELAPTLAHLSRFKDAEALLDRTDTLAGARRNTVSEIALRAQLARGDVALQRVRVNEALAEYQAAERLQRLLHPADAALSAHILLSIADCDLRMGKPKQAEVVARTILSGAPYTEDAIGLAGIATARSRLGDALRAQDRFKEAIPVVQQSLAEYEQAEGAGSQDAIKALSTLGYMYSWIDDYAKALPLQREVYQRAVKYWGAESQTALVELLNLGAGEYAAGDLESALPHLQQAEAGLTKVGGAKAPMTQTARVQLAEALSDQGQNDKALAMIRTVDPVAYQATTSDPGRALILRGIEASIELRLHQPGAAARLRNAITAMQAGGIDAEEISTFSTELPHSDSGGPASSMARSTAAAKAH